MRNPIKIAVGLAMASALTACGGIHGQQKTMYGFQTTQITSVPNTGLNGSVQTYLNVKEGGRTVASVVTSSSKASKDIATGIFTGTVPALINRDAGLRISANSSCREKYCGLVVNSNGTAVALSGSQSAASAGASSNSKASSK